ANRVRSKLFSFNDLMGVEDRSLQRVLSEVDLMTLAIALSGASEELRQRVQTNMSRRARESLIEEMELLPNISDEERAAAETRIVQAMLHLDEKGELMFIGGEDVD